MSTKKEKLFNLAKDAFPEMMNKTEASFYLWHREDIRGLNALEHEHKIFFVIEHGKVWITKSTLSRYLRNLETKFAA